jgi:O-antigen/teichoic acid export membrane protein
MSEEKNSYKQIFKATSIFGGVQVFNILIAIVRSKFVAILLGPTGMGIVGILMSNTAFITSLTSFGLSTSAVKNIAAAHSSGDDEKLGKVVATFQKLVWATGLLGFVVTLILAPWLSKLAFGNSNYTIAFMLISVTLFFGQLSAGQTVILRGMRKIQYMAKSSMFGALIGLFTSIPLYYFFGEKGIVPAIIITSITALLLTWYFSNKINIPKYKTDKELILTEGKEMLKMGFLISLSGLVSTGTTFLERIFINNYGSVGDVGLYVAGFSLIGTYVGMVFTAMSTDYYPRLVAVANDNDKCAQEVNQQAEIALLILAPILVFFLIFVKWAIVLLYSHEFVLVTSMVQWAALGIFFKAASWAMSIIFLAKSESKAYFWNEVTANIYLLVLNITGYYFWGLTGLGVSFLIAYFLYFAQVFITVNRLYSFKFSKSFIKIFIMQFSLAVLCFIIVNQLSGIITYLIGSIVIVMSVAISWKEMNKRVHLNATIKNLYLKRVKKS